MGIKLSDTAGMELSDVCVQLRGILDHPDSGSGGQEAVLEAMSALAQPPRFAELLRSLLASRPASAACADWSYLHPLGFLKLMLIKATPQFELRVHTWWSSRSPGLEHVHNHRFAFVSTVVLGGYDMQIFTVDETGIPMNEYEERARLDAGWRLEPVGLAHLRILTTARLRQGSSYTLAPEALHRVIVPPGALCATLVLHTATAGPRATRVFAEQGHPVPAAAPRNSLSHDDYRCQLQALLDELGD